MIIKYLIKLKFYFTIHLWLPLMKRIYLLVQPDFNWNSLPFINFLLRGINYNVRFCSILGLLRFSLLIITTYLRGRKLNPFKKLYYFHLNSLKFRFLKLKENLINQIIWDLNLIGYWNEITITNKQVKCSSINYDFPLVIAHYN